MEKYLEMHSLIIVLGIWPIEISLYHLEEFAVAIVWELLP